MVPPPAADADTLGLPDAAVSTTKTVRIVIADEHPIFRDGLRRLLETSPELRIVGDTDASEAVALVQALRPDILLLGWSSSAGVLLEAIQPLIAAGASIRIILLTGSIEGPAVVAAVGHGAHGVLPKDMAPEALFRSIKMVMEGQCWVGRECAPNLAAGVRRFGHASRRSKAFGLTLRELEIVRAVMSGDTNKAIAQRFSISENTVKRHMTHIFNKVGASTRVELALFATHHQLITPQ